MKGHLIWRAMHDDAWMRALPPELKTSAISFYGLRLIHSIRRAMLEDRIQISAKVATRDRGDCSVTVEVKGPSVEYIRTECSCPVGGRCKHAYAALMAATRMGYMSRGDLPPVDQSISSEPLWEPAGEHRPAEVSRTRLASAPRIILRLCAEYPFTGYVGWYSGVPYGQNVRLILVEFAYAEAPGSSFPYGSGGVEFPVTAGPDAGQMRRRDLEEERTAFVRLTSLGLQRCGDVLNYSLKTHLRDALVFFPLDRQPWIDLLLEQLPALERDGWTVRREEAFDLRVVRPDGWYEDMEAVVDEAAPLPAGKESWFKADIGMVVEGKRVQLLPVIARFVQQEGGMNLEKLAGLGTKPVLIPLDDHTVVPMPANRLHRILTALAEIFSGAKSGLAKDGSAKIHSLRAALLVGEIDPDAVHRTSESMRRLAQMLRDGATSQEDPPEGLLAELRPYQLAGFRWLRFLSAAGLGGILADDMGLGKTLQTLAHLLAEKRSGALGPSLIVAPTSVIWNWRDEARRFCPELKTHLHHGPLRMKIWRSAKDTDLIITSYPLLARDIDHIRRLDLHAIVLDEAQNIKNPRTRAAEAASSLRSRLRLCLSGTPLENHLGEMWSLYHFLMPGFLGTWEQFNTAFRTPIEKQRDTARQTVLSRRIAPVFLRRTKEAVLHDLPPRVDMLHRVELSPAQADLYESVRAAVDREVRAEIERRGAAQSQIAILDALLKLRQICCHPALLKLDAAQQVKTSAKLETVLETLEELIEEGRRILLFSQFTGMLELIAAELRSRSVPHLLLTGATKDRAALVNRFQSGEIPLFLISLKAGGTGLNLTAADTVIHYDPWWNPAAEAQATDRAHRMGQKKTVFVHRFICQGTIEDRILQLQEKKKALVAGLIGDPAAAAAAGQSISMEEVDYLLAPISTGQT